MDKKRGLSVAINAQGPRRTDPGAHARAVGCFTGSHYRWIPRTVLPGGEHWVGVDGLSPVETAARSRFHSAPRPGDWQAEGVMTRGDASILTLTFR